jgi:hypothetical protein
MQGQKEKKSKKFCNRLHFSWNFNSTFGLATERIVLSEKDRSKDAKIERILVFYSEFYKIIKIHWASGLEIRNRYWGTLFFHSL